MAMIDLINKKKQGMSLTKTEIAFIVAGIVNNTIPDYQISAWAMAVYFQGMTEDELYDFTNAMVDSGTVLDLSMIPGFKIDKHSTGGIGDKTSLVFAPIAASLGFKVAKLSGRSLGITGGTLDKLEAIPNFKVNLTTAEFLASIKKCGISIASQSQDLVPVDKKLYALRDVTGSVNSLPLIAASIMSKKLAIGADLIILDVKCGTGAFVNCLEEARVLANMMIAIGKKHKKKVAAIISDMNKPLGKAIGNILEVKEAVQCLKNQGPKDLQLLASHLVAIALVLNNQEPNLTMAMKMVEQELATLRPLNKFYEFIMTQGGDVTYLKSNSINTLAKHVIKIKAVTSGFINIASNEMLGTLALKLGAGKMTKTATIDPLAGILLHYNHGDFVKKDMIIAELHTNETKDQHDTFLHLMAKAITIDTQKPKKISLILEIIM